MTALTGPTVTVSIRREVTPEHVDRADAWMRSGTDLARHFTGYLGSGWVRESEDSRFWHMTYRFADAESLDAWERSPQRAWWLSTGTDFATEVNRTARSGIEGWFDAVPTGPVAAAPPAPARWKQAITIYLGFLPLTLLLNVPLGGVEWWLQIPLALRVILTTSVATPLMVYLILPAITSWLQPWLRARPRRRS